MDMLLGGWKQKNWATKKKILKIERVKKTREKRKKKEMNYCWKSESEEEIKKKKKRKKRKKGRHKGVVDTGTCGGSGWGLGVGGIVEND